MQSRSDARLLGETTITVVVTWLLLGWRFDRAISQGDGTVFGVPYTQSALHGGVDWTNHLYRFSVVGGAPMHDLAGSLPLVQLCALIGVSATTTANLVTIFLQICFAYFGITAAQALATIWTGASRMTSAPERIAGVWLCGFAPLLAWRFAVGHENLLFGLLPFVVGTSLLLAARAKTVSITTIVFAAIATMHGVSSFGSQLLVYSAVFGLPIAVALVLTGRPRWSRAHTAGVLAVIAGALVGVPRVLGMVQYALGDDASRTLGETVTYSFGASTWSHWLHSVPWTIGGEITPGLHEQNFPLGPVLLLAIGLWPKAASRRLWWAIAASAALAVLFALDVAPVSKALLAAIPPLRSFRVPARAIMPAIVLLPALALGGCWAIRANPSPGRSRLGWLGALIGALVIALGHGHVPILRELVVWIGCATWIYFARWRPARLDAHVCAAAMAVIAALGVAAFDERFSRSAPVNPIEQGPRDLHDAVIASKPELAMPLDRLQIVDELPYDVGIGFAAQLSTLDADFNPPRRFLELLGALRGKPLPSTTVVFRLTRTSMFPVLQQLYNVRYVVHVAGKDTSIETLPPTPGPAWFPGELDVVADPSEMPKYLFEHRAALGATIAGRAWLLAGDFLHAGAPLRCSDGKVTNVTTDKLGQSATIEVALDTPCVLVIATNYVSMLRATAVVDGVATPASVVPIDIALTGVIVPAHATAIQLAPDRSIPLWTRLAQLLGVACLISAVLLVVRARSRAGTPAQPPG